MVKTPQRNRSIVFITGQLGLGGAEKQLYLLVRGLLQSGWRISVMTLNPGRGDYWERPVQDLGLPVIPISQDSQWRRVLDIARRLKTEKAGIVHGWVLHAGSYANLGGLLAGVPVRLGGIRGFPSRQASSFLLQVSALYGLDGISINSCALAGALKSRFGRLSSPFRVIYNAVERMDCNGREPLRESLADRWGLNPRQPWVIALGRLDKNKNWGLLLQATRLITNQGRQFHLVFIGDGPERALLEAESARLGIESIVQFAGPVPQASTFLPAFDLLCLVSLTEGLPNVLMEASAAGLPVIASSVGGTPELVDDDVTGYLVAPVDLQRLVSRLEDLLADPDLRLRMGAAGREKMQREFSTEGMVSRFDEFYREMLRKKNL